MLGSQAACIADKRRTSEVIGMIVVDEILGSVGHVLLHDLALEEVGEMISGLLDDEFAL